jgi:hypothetical protein
MTVPAAMSTGTRCPGRWRAEVCLGYGPGGKRLRRRVSGPTKAAVQDALKILRADAAIGITKAAPVNYTIRAADDWLTSGLPGLISRVSGRPRRRVVRESGLAGDAWLRGPCQGLSSVRNERLTQVVLRSD